MVRPGWEKAFLFFFFFQVMGWQFSTGSGEVSQRHSFLKLEERKKEKMKEGGGNARKLPPDGPEHPRATGGGVIWRGEGNR